MAKRCRAPWWVILGTLTLAAANASELTSGSKFAASDRAAPELKRLVPLEFSDNERAMVIELLLHRQDGPLHLVADAVDHVSNRKPITMIDGVMIANSLMHSPDPMALPLVHRLRDQPFQTDAKPGVATTSDSNNNYYFSPVGSDSYDCLAPKFTGGSHGPCQTIAKANSLIYHGGDSLNFDNGNGALAATTPLLICGPGAHSLSNADPNNGLYPGHTACRQNLYPNSAQLTITNYGTGGSCRATSGPSGCAPIVLGDAQTNLVELINVRNVTVQNLALTTSPTATTDGTTGIIVGMAGSRQLMSGISVQNNYLKNFGIGIYALTFVGVTRTTVLSCTLRDNQVTADTPTTTADMGILINYSGNGCNAIGNVVSNMGGHLNNAPKYYGGCCGVGIEVANNAPGASLIEFNVIHDNGYNNHTCGGAFALETYKGTNVTVRHNEIYSQGTVSSTGCDNGAIDFDAETSNSIAEYNYTHNNWGEAYLLYAGAKSHFNNIVRYNISENDMRGLSGGVISVGIGQGPFNSNSVEYVYGNTIWVDSTGLYGKTWFEGIKIDECPASPSIVANNIWAVGKNPSTSQNIFVDLGRQLCNGGNGQLTWAANDWYAIGAAPNPRWGSVGGDASTIQTVAAWQAAIDGDVGATSANPQLASPGNGICYPSGRIQAGTQGQSTKCPSGYELHSGSPMIGVGFNIARSPYDQSVTTDYWGKALPHTSGTGWNIGADGAPH